MTAGASDKSLIASAMDCNLVPFDGKWSRATRISVVLVLSATTFGKAGRGLRSQTCKRIL